MKADFDAQQVDVFSNVGTRVISRPVNQEDGLEVDLPALSAGLYHIRVSSLRGYVVKEIALL